jgi:hypothetical protein
MDTQVLYAVKQPFLTLKNFTAVTLLIVIGGCEEQNRRLCLTFTAHLTILDLAPWLKPCGPLLSLAPTPYCRHVHFLFQASNTLENPGDNVVRKILPSQGMLTASY